MVAKRDDKAAGGFRFEGWTWEDGGDMGSPPGFKDARGELFWLINNVALARPEEERPALVAAGNRLTDLDEATVADMLKMVRTAMSAAHDCASDDCLSRQTVANILAVIATAMVVGLRVDLSDLSDQTLDDMFHVIETAMVAVQPKHSKVDHQKRRSDRKTADAMHRKVEVFLVADDKGIDPGQRHAPKLVESAMVARAKDPNRDYDIEVPSRRTIARALAELAEHRKSIRRRKSKPPQSRRRSSGVAGVDKPSGSMVCHNADV
jgi:hypothetical protein